MYVQLDDVPPHSGSTRVILLEDFEVMLDLRQVLLAEEFGVGTGDSS